MSRRVGSAVLAVLFAGVLVWYLVYTRQMARAHARDAAVISRMYARIFQDVSSPQEQPDLETLFELLREIEALGIPVVVTDATGEPAAAANLPFPGDLRRPEDRARVGVYARELDRRNAPIVEPGLGAIHFGVSRDVERLRWVPWIQAAALLLIVATAFWVVRSTARAERERLWAAMARESAHQLGTPLSSLAGWAEILRMSPGPRGEVAADAAIAEELAADVERLQKVARRFELIGQEARLEEVDVASVLRRLERYFRARIPRIETPIELEVSLEADLPRVRGNAVLLEWAFESLVKNSIDALAGTGGRVEVSARRVGPAVEVKVRDDGPGVPPELRRRIFRPGVSGKPGGWGLGLSLARRIVEETHGGRIFARHPARGAEFVIEIPLANPV
ncbi:MAG: HAMP domain-containing histidine kinase [Gemmatimonadetes bacterium]|nr:HAMP domain-containing histidine kinase [Gemmatimonadota bacterium]